MAASAAARSTGSAGGGVAMREGGGDGSCRTGGGARRAGEAAGGATAGAARRAPAGPRAAAQRRPAAARPGPEAAASRPPSAGSRGRRARGRRFGGRRRAPGRRRGGGRRARGRRRAPGRRRARGRGPRARGRRRRVGPDCPVGLRPVLGCRRLPQPGRRHGRAAGGFERPRRGGRRRAGARADVLVVVIVVARRGGGRRRGRLDRRRGLGRRRRRGLGLGLGRGRRLPLRAALALGGLDPARVQLPAQVAQRHVDRERELLAGLPPGRRQQVLRIEQLEVAQEGRVALALRLERVLVVPARSAEVRDGAAEVQPRGLEPRRVGGEQAQPDRRAVVDRVGHVPLPQQAAQPFGLAGRDLERLLRVTGSHVALAHVGQLDRPAVLVDQPGRPREGDELARPPERVLERRREQLLDGELGHELVEPHTLALLDRAQQAMGVAEAGGGNGTHGRTVLARGPELVECRTWKRPTPRS